MHYDPKTYSGKNMLMLQSRCAIGCSRLTLYSGNFASRRYAFRRPTSGTTNCRVNLFTSAMASKPETAAAGIKPKAKTALDEMSKDGEFKRTDAAFRNIIEEGGRFEPEGNHRLQFTLKLASQILDKKMLWKK